jgi:2Fe-2S ferredoxin
LWKDYTEHEKLDCFFQFLIKLPYNPLFLKNIKEDIEMPKVKFITADGSEKEINAENDVSLMMNAINNGIDGIVAECGGACSCATCHVIVDPEWYSKLPEPKNLEKDMLEFAAEPSETGRLSCQINVTDELDGLVVTVPSSQF